MSMHRLFPSVRTEAEQLAAPWLHLLTALPCQSRETTGLALPTPLRATAAFGLNSRGPPATERRAALRQCQDGYSGALIYL